MPLRHAIRLTLAVFTLSQVLAAAVDCRSPRNRQERVVCATPELMELDRQFASVYQKALAGRSAVERQELAIDQRSWEESSGGCWDRVDCIKKRYTDRIAFFKGTGLTAAQAVQAQALAEAKRQAEQPPVMRPADAAQSRIAAELQSQRQMQQAQQQAKAQSDADAVNDAKAAQKPLQLTPEQIAQAQAIETAKRQGEERGQQQKARTDAETALAEAQPRFDRLNREKEALTAALRGFEDMGPLPTVDPTVSPSRILGGRGGGLRVGRGGESGNAIIVERMNAESAKIEGQLPRLRDELTKRQKQAIVHARQILQESKVSIPQASQLSALIGESGTSPDGVLKAYTAAKKLEADLRALSAAKERAGKAIASAKAELGMATNTSDQETGTAAMTTAQTMNELSVKAQSIDPTETPQIIALATRLQAQSNTLHGLTREKAVMTTATGKRVYEGCYAWAKRGGFISGSQVRVFKDEKTNRAAEMATNAGVPFCRCVAVDIVGDKNITDAAKLTLARDLETKDKEDNQQLAIVAGAAFLKCQMNMMDNISGK